MKPKVSVITPSYNQGDYIEETIQSVLNQGYPELEYIIMDGGSTDKTVEILQQYDRDLKWISEKDEGQADAINKGFRISTGEILLWVNSDDVLLPGCVEKAVEFFRLHPDVKMVYGKSRFIDTNGNVIGSFPTEPFNLKRLAMFNFISQPSTFFTRDAFESVQGLDTTLHYALDYDLWIKIGHRFSVNYIPEYFSLFRLHDTSKTVDSNQAIAGCKESLSISMKHYNWAPSNRVYGYYYHVVESRIKNSLIGSKPFIVFSALIVSLIQYVYLNKGIRLGDLHYLRWKNLKKLGVNWSDLYKTYEK